MPYLHFGPTMRPLALAVHTLVAASLAAAHAGCDRPAGPAGAAAPPAAAPAMAPPSTPAAAPAQAPASPAAPAAPSAPVAAQQAPSMPVAQAAAAKDELPPIRLTPGVLDLGFMAPRAGGKGTVTLTNTGPAPLTIAAVTPSCKCTTTSALAGKVIAPGASETFEAVLEGASMPQTHRAVIKIAVDGYAKVLELQLRGETSMPVRCVPSILNAVEGKPRSGRFVVESVDGKPFRICSIGGRQPDFIGWAEGDAPKSQYLVRYDLDSWPDGHPAYLAIETDRADCPVLDVWVRTEGTIPRSVFRMKDYRINAGRIDVGGTAEVNVEMDDPAEDILAAEATAPDAQVEVLGQETKDGIRTVRLRIVPRGPRTGLIYTPVRLYGREREQMLTLFATVRAPGATGCAGCDPAPAPPRSAAPAEPAIRDLSEPARR